jgi:hypothetical protein
MEAEIRKPDTDKALPRKGESGFATETRFSNGSGSGDAPREGFPVVGRVTHPLAALGHGHAVNRRVERTHELLREGLEIGQLKGADEVSGIEMPVPEAE